FYLIVAFVSSGTELNFFYLNNFLFLFLLFGSFALFIKEFTVIHNTANRRFGIRTDLNQIQIGLFSQLQRLLDRYNSRLLTILVDQTDFLHTYFFIHTIRAIICRCFFYGFNNLIPLLISLIYLQNTET